MNLKTKVGRYTVSTVLLGGFLPLGDTREFIAESYDRMGGRYETMVFDDETAETDVLGLCNRYRSEEEAIRGHEETVTLVAAVSAEALEVSERS